MGTVRIIFILPLIHNLNIVETKWNRALFNEENSIKKSVTIKFLNTFLIKKIIISGTYYLSLNLHWDVKVVLPTAAFSGSLLEQGAGEPKPIVLAVGESIQLRANSIPSSLLMLKERIFWNPDPWLEMRIRSGATAEFFIIFRTIGHCNI